MSVSRPKREVEALLWTVAAHPLSIEIPWSVLEEIHGTVQEEYRRLSRGGVEAGGVLFGRRTEQLLRILAWRRIPCEHTRGPGFLLSNSDRDGVARLLEAAERDPNLRVLEPVGWFVSHTRSGVSMTPEDIDFFERFFPGRWQTTLVLHPERTGGVRAGFFLRDKDGVVHGDECLREFQIEETRQTPGPPPLGSMLEGDAPTGPEPEPARPFWLSPRWGRLAVIAAALVLGVWALFALPRLRTAASASPDVLALRLLDAQGHLRIEWNRASSMVERAHRGVLYITDAGMKTEIPLDTEAVHRGGVTYRRLSEDVSVRLAVFRNEQQMAQEMATYVGPPIPDVDSRQIRTAEEKRAKHQAETENLRQDLAREAERTRRLETTVKRLETMMQQQARP